MLPAVLNVPNTEAEWDVWAFNNAQEIKRCNTKIVQLGGPQFPDFPLYPIPWFAINTFLQNNQQAQFNITAILGQQSADLESVDLKDTAQKTAWVYLVHQQLFDAQQKLGI